MRKERVWTHVLGLERAVLESVEIDDNEQVVAAVRPHHRELDRCGVCGRRAPGFDLGEVSMIIERCRSMVTEKCRSASLSDPAVLGLS